MGTHFFRHYSAVPKAFWRWHSFSPQEIASKREGELVVDEKSMDMLQELRNRLGKPMIVTSGYRSPAHNKAVGGADKSYHMVPRPREGAEALGMAFDIVMANHNPSEFERIAVEVGFKGIGHYPASNFMHIDTRKTAQVVRFKGTGRNNAWFPDHPVTPSFTPEKPAEKPAESLLKPEVLAPIAAPIATGLPALTSGNGPVQWAFGIAIVIGVIVGIVFYVRRRQNAKPND